ncbi:MAG: hypothetical protein ABL977_13445 [Candidatus Eisenbacteria bacterium]
MLSRYARFALPALLALVMHVPPAAAVALDAPTLEGVVVGRTTISVMVTAGLSGAPQGFTIEWLPASVYDAMGFWPAPDSPTLLKADFRGTPTLNITDGTDSFALAGSDFAGVQLGDLFDETGVVTQHVGELGEGTTYVVRVRANASGAEDGSTPSNILRVHTLARTLQDCTYTQGYWKNHPEAWPVGSVTLGTVNYSAAQLMSIFNQPAAGNGLISLAHQLIAAKLNIAQGASAPAGVLSAIAAADALIGGLVVPPVGAGSLSPGSTSALTTTLDNFNQGITGPGHCATVPNKPSSWGNLKAMYR